MLRLLGILAVAVASGYAGYAIGKSNIIDITKKYTVSRIHNAGTVQAIEYLVINSDGTISFTGDEVTATLLSYVDAVRASEFLKRTGGMKINISLPLPAVTQ
jgi:hypothetical protein